MNHLTDRKWGMFTPFLLWNRRITWWFVLHLSWKNRQVALVFFAEFPPFGAGLLKNTQILPGLSNSLSALGGEKGQKIIQLGNTNYTQYCAALSLHVHGWATFPRSMEKLFFFRKASRVLNKHAVEAGFAFLDGHRKRHCCLPFSSTSHDTTVWLLRVAISWPELGLLSLGLERHERFFSRRTQCRFTQCLNDTPQPTIGDRWEINFNIQSVEGFNLRPSVFSISFCNECVGLRLFIGAWFCSITLGFVCVFIRP